MLENREPIHGLNCQSSEVTVNEEQYSSEFEQLNENFGQNSTPSTAFSLRRNTNYSRSSTKYQPESAGNTQTVQSRKTNGWHPRPNQPANCTRSMGGKNGGWRGNVAHQQSGVDRWETCQLALAEAQSQNVLLRKQLQECQIELRTVQRQYKLQSARLNKAIGHEADLPRIVDRLTADVRSLQIRLREKTNQYEAGQRKIKELQHRIFVLERELEETRNVVVPDDLTLRKQENRIEELRAELDREKKKVVSMQHQLEVTNRSHKHRLGVAQERIRQLKRSSRELEGQLGERTRILQEKIKLLELHNIYSQRLPKSIPAHLLSSDLKPEQDLYTTEAEVPADSETHKAQSSKILSLNSQIGKGRLKLNFGRQRKRRSDVSNGLVDRNAFYVEEKHTTQLSDTMLCFNEVACEEANSKTMESVTDISAVAPSADTGPASSEQYSDLYHSVSTDIVRKKSNSTQSHEEHSAGTDSCTKAAVITDTMSDQSRSTNGQFALRAVNVEQTMPAQQTPRRSQVHSQEGSPTLQPSPRQVEAEAQERERKRRLLKAMEQLDWTQPTTVPTRKSMKTMGDESNLDRGSMKAQTEAPEEINRLERQREQQLWDELFGAKQPIETIAERDRCSVVHHQGQPELVANSSNPTERPEDSLAKVKQEHQTKRSIFDSSPLLDKRSRDFRRPKDDTSHQPPSKSSSSIPTLPGLVYAPEMHPKRVHPKYTQPRAFRDENDSELEEFQA